MGTYLNDQNEIDESLEALRGEVIGDDFLRSVLPSEETDVAEEGLENGGGDVAPVEHAVELGRVGHVALERREKHLRRVAEHDDAQRNGEREDVDP